MIPSWVAPHHRLRLRDEHAPERRRRPARGADEVVHLGVVGRRDAAGERLDALAVPEHRRALWSRLGLSGLAGGTLPRLPAPRPGTADATAAPWSRRVDAGRGAGRGDPGCSRPQPCPPSDLGVLIRFSWRVYGCRLRARAREPRLAGARDARRSRSSNPPAMPLKLGGVNRSTCSDGKHDLSFRLRP